jgi:hypothetical protein
MREAMSRYSQVLVGVVGLVMCCGCGAMFPNDQAHVEAAMRNVQQRAPFDLGCNTPKLVPLGDVARLGQQMTRMNIGVTCDEKRASYTVTCVSNMGDITCTPEINAQSR